jgi:Ca-activated chloride channel family protein
MQFAAPAYLHFLWLVPIALALSGYALMRQRQLLAVFIDLALVPRLAAPVSRTRQWGKALCLAGALGCLVLALAQPQWGTQWQDVPRRGRDLMILLDVSRSMLAEDVAPNRLERAKLDIADLLHAIQQEGGHRVGLMAFAGRASLQCPLTLDYAFFLEQLKTLSPDTVGRGGTLIGDAVRQALQGFTTLAHNYKDIILITDGEDHDSFPLEAARAAAAQHVSIYTIGIGDAGRGAPIPVQEAEGQSRHVQYQGQQVLSRMHANLLLEMAQLTGGAYVPAGTRLLALDRLYREFIAPKARRDLDAARRARPVPRYQWFVAAALCLLMLDMLIGECRPATRTTV